MSKKNHLSIAIALAALAAGALAATPRPSLAHGSHRECEEHSSGRHRHTSTGERIPCAGPALEDRDLKSDPADRDTASDAGRTETAASPGADPGRDGLGATAARTAPIRERPAAAGDRNAAAPRENARNANSRRN